MRNLRLEKDKMAMSKYERLWDYVKKCGTDCITLTFDEVGAISGTTLDHSFLKYKKELAEYGWKVMKISTKERKVTFKKC